MKPIWRAGFVALLSLACQREEGTGSGSSQKEPSGVSAKAKASKTTDRGTTERSIPTAEPVPDQPGFVKSPYNGKIVDVTGVPAGIVVDDPGYAPEDKKQFRVPKVADLEAKMEAKLEEKQMKAGKLLQLDFKARSEARPAKPVPGKPGFIISPWDQKELDASGFKAGAVIMDPSSPPEAPRYLQVPDDQPTR